MDASGVLLKVSQLIQMLLLFCSNKAHSKLLLPCLKLLQPLLKDIRDSCSSSLGDASFLLSLENVLEKLVAQVGDGEDEGSRVARVIQCEETARSFHETSLALEEALSSIPKHVLDSISEQGRSQAGACILELKRAKCHVDISDLMLCNEIQTLLIELRERQHVRPEKLLKLFDKLSITSDEALSREMDALESAKERARTDKKKAEEELFERVIAMFMQMVRYSPDGLQTMPEMMKGLSIPADFRCPLCLELMGDPVIIASGQTYERAYIQQWLEQGNTTCPKTRKVLEDTSMIQNFTVKALITNWCESHDVPLPEPAKLSTSLPMRKLSLIQRKHAVRDGAEAEEEDEEGYANRLPRSVRTHTRASSFTSYHRGSPLRGNGAASPNHDWSFASARSGPVVGSNLRASPSGSSGSSEGHTPEDGLATPRTMDASINLSDYSPYNSTSDASGDFERMASMLGGAGGSPASSFRRHHHSPAHSFPSLMTRPSGGRSTPQHRSRRPPSAAAAARHMSDGALQVLVENSLEDLKSDNVELQLIAARELRLLAKHDDENRIVIASAGAIPPLVSLLDSSDMKVQENAVTALLNLSIDNRNKSEIAASGAVPKLVRVLKVGSPESMQNAAAALVMLSVLDENRSVIAASGAIPPLIDLLNHGSFRGQKDAATALFNLSLLHENKASIVNAGAVNAFIKLVKEPTSGMVDKAVAVLANLMTVPQGRVAIGEGGGIAALVEVVEAGTSRGKENAAAALLHLCTNSTRHRSMVLQEGAIPPLHALSQSGTPRAKEKASALLRYFREQRQSSFGSGKQQQQQQQQQQILS